MQELATSHFKQTGVRTLKIDFDISEQKRVNWNETETKCEINFSI